nr:retrotransposon protein, putative, Ty1-copia subclass [Tanacetum cinerariifolium]
MKVEESLNVTFDETPPPPKTSPFEDDDLVEEQAIEVSKKTLRNDLEDKSLENNEIINIKESKSRLLENVIGQQIKQLEDVTFFNQSKYIKEMLKKFRLEDSKPMKTLISMETKLTKDVEGPISCLVFAFVNASKRILKSLTLKRLKVSSDTLKALCTYDYGIQSGLA